jgi:hypothetical protein
LFPGSASSYFKEPIDDGVQVDIVLFGHAGGRLRRVRRKGGGADPKVVVSYGRSAAITVMPLRVGLDYQSHASVDFGEVGSGGGRG